MKIQIIKMYGSIGASMVKSNFKRNKKFQQIDHSKSILLESDEENAE